LPPSAGSARPSTSRRSRGPSTPASSTRRCASTASPTGPARGRRRSTPSRAPRRRPTGRCSRSAPCRTPPRPRATRRASPPVPELPEVETVRDGLDRLVVGAVVRDVEVFRDYSVRRHDGGPGSFRDQLVGRRLSAAVRRGKFLWLPLGSGVDDDAPAAALLAHLGMSGQLLVR